MPLYDPPCSVCALSRPLYGPTALSGFRFSFAHGPYFRLLSCVILAWCVNLAILPIVSLLTHSCSLQFLHPVYFRPSFAPADPAPDSAYKMIRNR